MEPKKPLELPFENCYWVMEGKLLAGEYPVNPSYWGEETNRLRLGTLLDAGVDHFIDLTRPNEAESYQGLLQEEAQRRHKSVDYQRFAIDDFGVAAHSRMVQILNAIDQAIAAGGVVYLHCHGGIGRTGSVVGCFLVRHGLSGKAALRKIRELRQVIPGCQVESPETDAQRYLIRDWIE